MVGIFVETHTLLVNLCLADARRAYETMPYYFSVLL
jgi:hypothetical protein